MVIARRFWRPAAECAFLAVLAIAIDLYYGRRGFMPLDQSIVYDGAWRTLHGQVPYRDYITPFGTPAFVIQAGFFAVFGVSWLAFCLHGAVVNALAAIAAFALLRMLAVPRWVALAAAACTAVVFYPPAGTGFPDNDSFFFVLLAVTLAVWAQRSDGRRERALWACVPLLVLLGTLCKEIPGAVGVVLVLAVVATGPPHRLRRSLVWLAVGTAGCAVLAAIVIAATGMKLGLISLALIDLPLTVGGDRSGRIFGLSHYNGHWLLLIPRFAYVAFAVAALVGWRLKLLRRGSAELQQLVLGLGLFVTGELFWVATLNDIENTFELVFVVAGLLAGFAASAARHAPGRRVVEVVGVLLLAGLFLHDAYAIDRQANGWRVANNILFREPTAAEQRALPPSLRYMRWQLPIFWNYTPGQLTATADYLRAQPGNFMLVGDTTILYALAHRPSTFPAMFLDPGEGYPRLGSAGYPTFDALLARNLKRWHVRRIVIEPEPTLMASTLLDFPRLLRLTRSGSCATRTFGPFVVRELCRPA